MGDETERSVWPDEQRRVGYGVCESDVGERSEARKRPVKVIGPVDCRPARAQAAAFIARRSGAGERGRVIDNRIGGREFQLDVRVSNAVGGCRADQRRGGFRWPHEVHRKAAVD